MATTVKVAGTAMFKGEMKVRFADDMTYVKRMAKGGNTEINLVELPNAMTRHEAVKYLLTTDMAKVAAVQATLDDALARYEDIEAVAAKKAALTTLTPVMQKVADIAAKKSKKTETEPA